MANSNLEEEFHIDGNELDGLTPQECFTLGVEWCLIYKLIQRGIDFDELIDVKNLDRIKKMLEKHNRQFTTTFMKNDRSESWVELSVEGIK